MTTDHEDVNDLPSQQKTKVTFDLVLKVFTALSMAYVVFAQLSGGWASATQTALAELTRNVSAMQTDITAVRNKVADMPTSVMYADVYARLESLREQARRDEIAAESVRTKVENLAAASQASVRMPR